MTNQLASIGVFGAIIKWSDTKIFGKFLSGDAQSAEEEHYEEDVDLCSAPTEEASYADDELEPEEEWLDTYYRENPNIPHDEYDFDGF